MKTKFVRLDDWDKVKLSFSQPERDLLNKHKVGELLCPRGIVVALDPLPVSLVEKLNWKLPEKP